MRAAIVRDGIVVNLVVLPEDADWRPPYGDRVHRLDADTPCDIGWEWGANGPIEPPAPEAPASPVAASPGEKLAAFLIANPDVARLIGPADA